MIDHVARLRAAAVLLDTEQCAAIGLAGTAGVCGDAADEIERLRRPWSAVVDTDWDFLLNKTIGYGGHEQFWRAVLTEMREALSPHYGQGDSK